jgi:hypothetical protein
LFTAYHSVSEKDRRAIVTDEKKDAMMKCEREKERERKKKMTT